MRHEDTLLSRPNPDGPTNADVVRPGSIASTSYGARVTCGSSASGRGWRERKRGGGPQRRTVMTVFGSAVEVVEQYVAEIRPCFGAPRHPAMFLTERGTRIRACLHQRRTAGSAQPDSDERTLAKRDQAVAATTSLRFPERRPESRC